MRITVVGGGPAGLYFSILMQQAQPGHDITVLERNRADDTFGFGVVFSDETLGHFRDADAETYHQILDNFAYWDEIDTHFRGEVIRSTGHGFCGISRHTLLDILQRRAAALGVKLRFEVEVDPAGPFDADLVVAADGVNSALREAHADVLRPHIEYRPNKFAWMGTTVPLKAFTFAFKENRHGIWNVHAYRYRGETATFIIETTEDAWRSAGLEHASEAESAAYVEDLFADLLQGTKLLTNRSTWRNFPVIHCEQWSDGNLVILGDAAHTAHFSIGSGTKLAMEDAIALSDAFVAHPGDVPAALAHYDTERRPDVEKTQHAADVSLVWFENVRRFWDMHPIQFNFALLSRSKQITIENLRRRDAALVDDVERWFADDARAQGYAVPADRVVQPMFAPFRLRGMQLANRVVVSPMAQYCAADGQPGDWHLVHLGGRAVGGAGLVVTEMTCPAPDARITPGCTGLWCEAHRDGWARVVDFVHANSPAKIALQLGHAGRKGSTQLGWEEMDRPLDDGNWPLISASALPYLSESQVPKAMDRADMDRVIAEFVRAARWGDEAGFDLLELHMAHGYLLASFLSPLTNKRDDEYGGGIDNRLRFPLELFNAARAVWPDDKPISVRLSATDWMPDGNTGADTVAITRAFKAAGCDLIDVSAGQTVPDQQPIYGRMFQTPFADQVRNDVGIATVAVGNITTADQVNTILAAGRADLVALARPHLADPYFTLRAAAEYGQPMTEWPLQYLAGRDQAFVLAERNREELEELRRQARSLRPQHERQAAD
ncbi:MAG: bifunctional salicylyl-CoA 5-hydroxylase/oxidoreductase [Alphaproteobacteria bacterium]